MFIEIMQYVTTISIALSLAVIEYAVFHAD